MIWAALVAAVLLAAHVYQDGIHRCQDGDRYTSGERQPTPFNRRFCGWPARLLMVVTWASLVATAGSLGSWRASLLFMTLPGVWFCAIHPTTVDGPAMSLALLASSLSQSGHPLAACALAMCSGFIHERGPVFAALYAWSPLLLLGLAAPLAMSLLRKPAAPNHQSPELADRLVGHGTWGAIAAHRPYVDLLGDTGLLWSLRGLPILAAYVGAGPSAWAALAVAFASRLVGTDTSRFLMWAAPPLCAASGNAPLWMIALHVLTFRRAAQ